MADVTFTRPDLDTFAGVDGLGLVITGQRIEVGRAVLACRVIEPDPWCRRCGGEGRVRDSVDASAGACAIWLAANGIGGYSPPVPLPRMRDGVASGHHRRGRAAGQAVPGCACGGRWRPWSCIT